MTHFLGTEYSNHKLDNARVVVIPFPVEFSTSYGKGTKYGPAAILKASPFLEFYDEELDLETWKIGIYTASAFLSGNKPGKIIEDISHYTQNYLNKFIVGLGGEHTITLGIYKAFDHKYKDFSILQLDAHSDLRDNYEGLKLSHACVMRRIYEIGGKIIQVGVRSQSNDERLFTRNSSIKTYYAYEIYENGFQDTIIDHLAENVFITIDTDFFDPAVMPSTGTPEPGGFFWNETLQFLKNVFKKRKVVGFDLVEFSPLAGVFHPDFFCAKLIYKLIGFHYKYNDKAK
jgi:agmatinase